MTTISVERLRANLAAVRERMAATAVQAGRRPEEVQLVAVTKYVDADVTRQLIEVGCLDLGESRPQQLWEKAAALNVDGVRWHLIGSLQRNKIRRTIPLVHLLHSGDRLSLLEDLNREQSAAASGSPLPVLLEVNVSGDATKHGFTPEELSKLLDSLTPLTHLQIRGLMAMAGLEDDPATARRRFAQLRELRDRLRSAWTGRFTLDELSMGMSGDFEAAIAEGATIVRIGSALFEE
jgi:PLP dependent protein